MIRKLQRLAVMLYVLTVCAGFFCRRRSRTGAVLIVTPLRLGDFCMWLPFTGALTGYFRARNLRIILLIPAQLAYFAEKHLDYGEIIYREYPQELYSLAAMRRLARKLSNAAGTAVAVSVERAFFYDDLPRIFTGAARFHSARAVPMRERFWGKLSILADKLFFRGTAIELPDYENTPELQNYQYLTGKITGTPLPVPQTLSAGNRAQGTLLAPFAQDPARSCDIDKIISLLPYLPQPVILAGTRQDSARAQEICAASPVKIRNLCGQTTLPQLVELVCNSDLVLGANSGIANIGVICGKKVIAFSGQADQRFIRIPPDFTAYGLVPPQNITARWQCPFAGCRYHCHFPVDKTYKCLNEIELSDAIAALTGN